MSSEKEENGMQPKVNKQPRRRGELVRVRLPARTPRRQDLGDLRLQFLLEATSLLR